MSDLCQSCTVFSMGKVLKILVPASILLFLVWIILQNWLSIREQFNHANLIFICLSLLILLLVNFGGAFFWYKILKTLSAKIIFKEALRIFIVSNFGRFIPGVFIHYVARVYLVKKLGLSAKEGISSVFLEAYYTLAGAMIVGLISLSTVLKLLSKRLLWNEQLITIILIFILIFILFVPAKTICKFISKIPVMGKYVQITDIKQNFWEHLGLIIISSTLFLLYGLGFYFLSVAFLNNNLIDIISSTGLLSVSWIIGFLTPIAPGGLGVSDLSFAYFLSPFYGFSMASFLVVIFRFCLFITEGLMFLIVMKIFNLNIVSSNIKLK